MFCLGLERSYTINFYLYGIINTNVSIDNKLGNETGSAQILPSSNLSAFRDDRKSQVFKRFHSFSPEIFPFCSINDKQAVPFHLISSTHSWCNTRSPTQPPLHPDAEVSTYACDRCTRKCSPNVLRATNRGVKLAATMPWLSVCTLLFEIASVSN